MVLATLLAVMMTLLDSSAPSSLAYSNSEPQLRPHFDQIRSGSFRSGSPRDCKDSEIALVSWNIERGVHQSEIVEALRGPLAADLYLLQEVDWKTRRTGYRDVAEEMAHSLLTNFVFGIEFEELAQGSRASPAFQGQAVLSRCPISRARMLRYRHQLHNWGPGWMPRWSWLQPRRGGRMALIVEMSLSSRPWVIYNTHLESKANDSGRAQQIQEILEDIRAHYPPDTPVIIAGDLNTSEGSESPVLDLLRVAGFQDVFQDHKGPVRTKLRSRGRADWIFVRHLEFSGASIARLTGSDHYPLIVRIKASAAESGPPHESQPD